MKIEFIVRFPATVDLSSDVSGHYYQNLGESPNSLQEIIFDIVNFANLNDHLI